jgi:hypothetical protein
MLKKIAFLLLPTLLVACGDYSLVKTAKNRVREQMRDPDSVQFRNVQAAEEDFVCGEVNAKNAFGAYVGFSKFSYDDFNKKVCVADMNGEGCGKTFDESLCSNKKGGREAASWALLNTYTEGCKTGMLRDWFIGKEHLCNEAQKHENQLKAIREKYGTRIAKAVSNKIDTDASNPNNVVELEGEIYDLMDGWRVIWKYSLESGDSLGYFFKSNSDVGNEIRSLCNSKQLCTFKLGYKDLDSSRLRKAFDSDFQGASYYGEVTHVININKK